MFSSRRIPQRGHRLVVGWLLAKEQVGVRFSLAAQTGEANWEGVGEREFPGEEIYKTVGFVSTGRRPSSECSPWPHRHKKTQLLGEQFEGLIFLMGQ